MDSHESELTVEVYVRPAQQVTPVDATIDALDRLDDAGRINDLSVQAWPGAITLSERTPHTEAIDAFRRMEAWADDHGASIRPPFTVRTTGSPVTEETRTTLRTPVVCLAVYVGERLANVFPHSQGDERYGVGDAIAALRTGDLELLPSVPEPSAPPPERCPACERRLTNVQGIGVCENCSRIELATRTGRERRQRPRLSRRA